MPCVCAHIHARLPTPHALHIHTHQHTHTHMQGQTGHEQSESWCLLPSTTMAGILPYPTLPSLIMLSRCLSLLIVVYPCFSLFVCLCFACLYVYLWPLSTSIFCLCVCVACVSPIFVCVRCKRVVGLVGGRVFARPAKMQVAKKNGKVSRIWS